MSPIWHLNFDIDIREHILDRPRARAYFARYGRQDYFCDCTIPELERAVRAIVEIVKEENELNRLTENQ